MCVTCMYTFMCISILMYVFKHPASACVYFLLYTYMYCVIVLVHILCHSINCMTKSKPSRRMQLKDLFEQSSINFSILLSVTNLKSDEKCECHGCQKSKGKLETCMHIMQCINKAEDTTYVNVHLIIQVAISVVIFEVIRTYLYHNHTR